MSHPTKIKKYSVSNESWYVDQTRCEEKKMVVPLDPMDLKFDAKAKFNIENSKITGKLDIDGHLINYHDLSKLVPLTQNSVRILNSI